MVAGRRAEHSDRRGTGVIATTAEVRRWVKWHARPLSLDPAGPPLDLPQSLARAQVVGLASSVRSARELVAATHVLLRALVEQAGFRAVAIEGTQETGMALDRFVRTGAGDPAALLAASQSFLRVHEALTVVRSLRAWTREHPDDPLSVVHDPTPYRAPAGLTEAEAALARADLTWHADTGQRIVHWGGTAHLVVGDPRTIPPGETQRNAGGIMHAELGPGYAVAALTVGSGLALFPVPPPPRDFAEAAFADVTHDTALLDLADAHDPPPAVRDWLHSPLRTRMIGPVYDETHDHDFRLDTGPLADCVDLLVHTRQISPTRPLTAEPGARTSARVR
jgi:erythromycin esterase